MDKKTELDEMIEKAIKAELKPITEDYLYERYDECYDCDGDVHIGNLTFSKSAIVKELDPIAYSCGFSDWLDGEDVEEIAGEYYRKDEVEEIRERITDEAEDVEK